MTRAMQEGNRATTQLRELLARPGMVLAPFVFDGLQAKAAEAAGFEAVYMTGFGTAAARGYPDVGLLTLTEMVDNARTIARSVTVPVVSDADTGYGNPVNVVRTVHEFEAAGVAAIHIEDQVWPKRCGFLEGKEVIPVDRAAARYGLHRKGDIAPGYDADLVLFDPDARFTVRAADSPSGQGYTPFEGLELVGRVNETWLRGERVYDRGKIVGLPRGLYLRRPYGDPVGSLQASRSPESSSPVRD